MLGNRGDGWQRRTGRLRSNRVVDLLYRAGRDFSEHHGTVYAAATSYYALTSLLPLLILLATVFGWLAGGTDLQSRVVNFIISQFPPGMNLTRQIDAVLRGRPTTQGGILGIASFLGTMWTASGMFGVLRRALNKAFDVAVAHSFIHGRLYDLASVGGVGLLSLLSVGVTAALSIARAVTSGFYEGVLTNAVWTVAFFLVPFVVSYAAFVLLYRLIPNQRVGMGAIRLGALLATIGFELAKLGFTLYVAYFGRYQQIYGALGGAVALLFFIYIESAIVIFSAELASELAKDRAGRLTEPAAAPTLRRRASARH